MRIRMRVAWRGYQPDDEPTTRDEGGQLPLGVADALVRAGRAVVIGEPQAKKKRGRPPKAKEAKPDAPTDDTAEPDAD